LEENILNPDFLQDIFLEETWKNVDRLDSFIENKQEKTAPIQIEKDEVNGLFRLLHSIKGSASMMGYLSIAETAHGAEDLFAYLRDEESPNESDLKTILRLLRMVSGYMKRELRRMETGEDITDFGWAVVKRIKNFLEHVESEGELESTNDGVLYTRKGRKTIPFTNFQCLIAKAERLSLVMGREFQKDVSVEILGMDTEVPRDIFDKISMAILQMIKNSIDHGIESREERQALGKSIDGHIIIEIKKTPQSVLVSFRDDGRGLDKNKILDEAYERGNAVKPIDQYTNTELYSFLLKPGFTTKSRATLFSGRGVGLDVVNAGIASLGGSIQIESCEHMGTTFFMELPLV